MRIPPHACSTTHNMRIAEFAASIYPMSLNVG
jgi:hypothetical protein